MRIIMSAVLLAASCMTCVGQEIQDVVTALLNQYPQARLLDVYKSCFQDYMGAEHLVGDTASVRAYLEQALANTEASALQPWYYEPCGIEGNFVRVSLRAVIEGKITADELMEAFITSANTSPRPSVSGWAERWHEIVAAIEQMGISLPDYDQDKLYIDEVLSQGKYAISHSLEYRTAYAPHYRIVRRDIFERDLFPKLR